MGYNMLPRKKLRTPRAIADGPDALNEARASFVNSCSGDVDNPALRYGTRIFTDLVENRMLDCESIMSELTKILRKYQPTSPYLERQFRLCTTIVGLLSSATAQTTIDDVTKQVYDQSDVSTVNDTPHQDILRLLVFAVIGWSTMLYTTRFEVTDFSTVIEIQSTNGSAKSSVMPITDLSQRPIGTLLRTYGLMPIACTPAAISPQEVRADLIVPHLNFYSLSRLGGVTVTWVDNLSEHCEFDRYSKKKQLKMFRLPSLCAKLCLNKGSDTPIDRLSKSHICDNDCHRNSEPIAKAYLVEVLLSYRLLFGQHSLSRRLFSKQERENARQNGVLDPLLDTLCSCEDVDGFNDIGQLLRERGVYDAHVNFPHLGARLIELADYSSSQRPRNLIEVWSDQRDPERLLTFKAVIIVGGATIILSILQVFVGIVQIAVTIQN